MIKANELRLGNWFLSKVKVPVQVEKGTIAYMCMRSYEISKIKYEPIPLTPEILEKCGFVIETIYYEYPYFDFDIKSEYGKWQLYYNGDAIGIPFEYLHQLQNLYFALTSEELEIKL